MSEFIEIEVKENADAPIDVWKAALELLGFKVEQAESEEKLLPLFGYQGDIRPQKVILRIDRHQLRSMSNDAGIYRNSKGKLALYLSEYDMSYNKVDPKDGLLKNKAGEEILPHQCSNSLRKLFFELPGKNKEVKIQQWKTQATKDVTKALKKLGYSRFSVTDKTLKAIKL